MARWLFTLGLVLSACAPTPPREPAARHVCTPTPHGLAECHLVERGP